MDRQPLEITLESKIDSLPAISSFVESALDEFNVDPGTAFKVQLVIDEAATNVIKHAYSGGEGLLKLSVGLSNSDLIIVLKDKGKPFDPKSVPPPDLDKDLEDRKIGGLGIYFMQQFMDSVEYSFDDKDGNRLTMKKHIRKSELPEPD